MGKPIIVLLLLAFFSYTSLSYGEEKRVMIPYSDGVSGFSYSNAFWLVSPPLMTDLLTAYATMTNYQEKITAQENIIAAFNVQTNLDAKLMYYTEEQNKILQKDLRAKKIQLVFFTTGGIAFGVGFTTLIYKLAAEYLKSISQ